MTTIEEIRFDKGEEGTFAKRGKNGIPTFGDRVLIRNFAKKNLKLKIYIF
jgi:hypothetical protein